jgi:hypothetical protein
MRYTDTQLSSFMSRTNDPDAFAARINKKYADEYHLSSDELSRIQPGSRRWRSISTRCVINLASI